MSGAAFGAKTEKNAWTRIPLSIRIVASVALGIGLGLTLRDDHRDWLKTMGALSKLFIDLLKALATPLIFFAVIDALVRTRISGKKGVKLVLISLTNAAVAIVIGLGVANILKEGKSWEGHLDAIVKEVSQAAAPGTIKKTEPPAGVTIDPLKQIESYIPKNFIDPFKDNNIITVVLMAILAGVALRKIRRHATDETLPGVVAVENGIQTMVQVFAVMLTWIVEIIPFAICGVVAMVVGDTGMDLFRLLWKFLFTILLGLFLHSVVYYSFLLFVIGRTSPARFYKGASEAILTAMSCGSSLATLPVTLRCLKEKLKISDANARLAACVGTNLNHDGIILYEAAATIFVAQALGQDLTFAQQMNVALASVLAGVGIAGVPEAGFITLQLVLDAGGIKPTVVSSILPILLTVDWIIGRGRATVNVISDMTVATLLERIDPPEPAAIDAPASAPATPQEEPT